MADIYVSARTGIYESNRKENKRKILHMYLLCIRVGTLLHLWRSIRNFLSFTSPLWKSFYLVKSRL